jgi:hypothetical protein
MRDQERIIATIPLGARSFLRVAVNSRDGGIIIRKFTANGQRIFLPTGMVLKLSSLTEARGVIAGITEASADVWK